jgi:hypothetical protein
MKKAFFAVLLLGSASAHTQEPRQPAAPAAAPPPGEQLLPPLKLPPLTLPPLRLGDIPKVLPEATLEYPDGRVVRLRVLPTPGTGCYFIRTLRPVLPEGDARRSGFIPLQAQVLGTVSDSDCVGGGALQRLVPVQRLLYR